MTCIILDIFGCCILTQIASWLNLEFEKKIEKREKGNNMPGPKLSPVAQLPSFPLGPTLFSRALTARRDPQHSLSLTHSTDSRWLPMGPNGHPPRPSLVRVRCLCLVDLGTQDLLLRLVTSSARARNRLGQGRFGWLQVSCLPLLRV